MRGHVGAALEGALHSGCVEAEACARASGVWAQACAAVHCSVQVLAVLAVQRIMRSACVSSVATRLAAARMDGVCGADADKHGGVDRAPVARA